MRLVTTLAALCALFASLPLMAAVPATMSIQGQLLSAAGGPVADGSYSVTFKLYPAQDSAVATWTEAGVKLDVKGGLFQYALGTAQKLDGSVFEASKSRWLGLQVGIDPELSRNPVHAAPYAMRAMVAEGLDCSGCVTAGQLDPGVLAGYAKTADLGAYAKAADMAGYAKTGELSAYAKAADLKAVATSGAYADLSGLPVLAKLGAPCGSGLVAKGIKADGSMDCIGTTWGDLVGIPAGFADGIDNTASASDLAPLLKNNNFDLGAGSTIGGAAVPKLLVVGPKVLGSGEVLDTAAGASAGLLVNAWVQMPGGGWAPISSDRQAFCAECGNGSDGIFFVNHGDMVSSDLKPINGGEYQVASLTIGSPYETQLTVLRAIGPEPLVIRSTGPVRIYGKLDLQGTNGDSTDHTACTKIAPAQPGAGGGAGGMYKCGCQPAVPSCTGLGKGVGLGGGGAGVGSLQSGGGGGYVSKGQDAPKGNGIGGPPWGDQALTAFVGGSGGGGGHGKSLSGGVSSGGAGGGAVKIIAPSIKVAGTITVNGGAGSDGYYDAFGAGGGGSGGSVWLRARVIEVTGSITAKGGPGGTYNGWGTYSGAGADGRIRLDYSIGSPVTDPPFYKGDNGPEAGMVGLSMYQVKAGTVRVDNQTGAQQTVMLVIGKP